MTTIQRAHARLDAWIADYDRDAEEVQAEERYSEGYRDGVWHGYDDGYSIGNDRGYEEGYRAAVADREDESA